MTSRNEIGTTDKKENIVKTHALYEYLLKFAKLRQRPTVNLCQ